MKKISQSEELLNIASDLTLFHDQHEEPLAFLDGQTVILRSKRFRQWLSYKFFLEHGKAPNMDSLKQAITVLQGKAIFKYPQVDLFNRIAKHENAFWYDMGDRRAIRISCKGWKVIEQPPIIFRRYAHQQIQCEPVERGIPWRVFQFLNVDSAHHILVLVYIISCFVPDIPHPPFHPFGPQGSGKTTLCRVIKRLCDPSTIETLITPRDYAQLVQVIAHHHVCLFDNMNDLPSWMSDILAQACTGGGFSKRQLYTDDDDIVYQFRRCIGINGISNLISKPDLMDRSILLNQERIDSSKRIDESRFWNDFERLKPEILGGIFDILSKAIGIYPKVHLENLPRMADFCKWGYAITLALGREGKDFLNAYKGNIEKQNEEVLSSNTLAQAVIKMMEDDDSWDGYVKQAWQKLHEIASPDKHDPTFPKSDRTLRRLLARIKTNLEDVGITFKIGMRESEGIPITFLRVKKTTSFATFATGSTETSTQKQNNYTSSTPDKTLKAKVNVVDVDNEDIKPIFGKCSTVIESEVKV